MRVFQNFWCSAVMEISALLDQNWLRMSGTSWDQLETQSSSLLMAAPVGGTANLDRGDQYVRQICFGSVVFQRKVIILNFIFFQFLANYVFARGPGSCRFLRRGDAEIFSRYQA